MTETLPAFSARMSARDEMDLEWYLSAGQAAFERSTFGSQLDRAAAAYRDSSDRVVQPPGSWNWSPPERVSQITGQPLASEPGCMVVRETRGEGGQEPTHEQLTRYARVSRRLERTGRLLPTAAIALRAYYGDEGALWGQREVGRVWSLSPLTHTGARLLAGEAALEVGPTLRPAERLHVLWALQRIQPKEARGSALRRVFDQADALYVVARQMWNAAGAL